MKTISLTKGFLAIVDDADFAELSKHRWHIRSGYAYRSAGRGINIAMHSQILPGGLVDHINRNKLDNRRSNLRLVTRSENAVNSKLYQNNTSGYKGVYKTKGGKWRAYFKNKHLGVFSRLEDARKAYLSQVGG